MINKIGHIIWMGSKIPKFQQKIIDKNTKILEGQGFDVVIWDNISLAKEFTTMPSWVIKAILDKKYSLATDYFRIELIYRYGGVYIDADHELIREIPDFILESNFFTGRLPAGYITSSLFGASRGNKTLLKIINQVKEKVNIYNYIKLPRVEALFIFGEVIEKNKSRVLILESAYMYPFFPGEKTVGVTENTFAKTYYTFTWSDSIVMRLCNKFGLHKLSLFLRKFTNIHEHF